MTYAVRAATPEDVPILVEARRMMFAELYEADPADVALVDVPMAEWMAPRMPEARALGFIAEDEAGCWHGALSVARDEVAPSLGNPSGLQDYLFGLWVRPESRRRGIAEALVSAAIEVAERDGVGAVTLLATDAGKPLYEKLGFGTATFMRRLLAPLPIREERRGRT